MASSSTSLLLPTANFGKWKMTSFSESITEGLKQGGPFSLARGYFYAVTVAGVEIISPSLEAWFSGGKQRKAVFYVGTDHGITAPDAITQLQEMGVEVRLMVKYRGIYHPKALWLHGRTESLVWAGSNNLTRDGMLHNVEMGIQVVSKALPAEFRKWHDGIHAASKPASKALLKSYEAERDRHHQSETRKTDYGFTWSGKAEPDRKTGVQAGDLVLEIMPRETGPGGKQIQIPLEAASAFFNVPDDGSPREITLVDAQTNLAKTQTMRVYDNRTVRLSLSVLEYEHRPCVVIFRKTGQGIQFEIVSKNIAPGRYKALIGKCTEGGEGRRLWGLVTEKGR